MLMQIVVIVTCTYLGELVTKILPLPIPASIYGFALLFLALYTKVIKISQVDKFSSLLIQNMSFLFIPITLKLTQTLHEVSPQIYYILALITISTLTTMIASGKLAQLLMEDQS